MHISIFVQLCETFLEIHPHFDLFKSLFSLNPFPNPRNTARVGGADLQFRPGTAEKYIPYTLHHQIGDWKAEWFYIDNHALALPERTPGPPQKRNEWYARAENVDQVDELLEKVAHRRKAGVTGATVVVSVGVFLSGSPRGIPRRVVVSRDSP